MHLFSCFFYYCLFILNTNRRLFDFYTYCPEVTYYFRICLNINIKSVQLIVDNLEIFHTAYFYIVKHLSNYTNQTHNIYSLHIFNVFLLHVSVHHTPSSERTCVPLDCYAAVVNGHYSSCVFKYKSYNFAFTEITIICTTVYIASVALLSCMLKA